MKKILIIACMVMSSTVYAQSVFETECDFAKSSFRAKVNGVNKNHVESLIIDKAGNLPSFLVKRIFNIINTAYSLRYPTMFYTPESFAKSAYGCI